jgi:cysteine desulfurase
MDLPVYMDYHATTPCDPEVLEAMMPYFSGFYGNASSKGHQFGWQAAEAVNIAREQLAAVIGADPAEIVFTSGATESINLALKGSFEMFSASKRHFLVAATEHRAVLDSCVHLEKQGADIGYLPVGSDGLIDLEQLASLIRPDTIGISVMYANNETGVIQPIRAIGALAREHGLFFFTDATQALGKLRIDVEKDGIDLLACSAHKIYGPKGVGALYVRRKNPRVRLTPQMDGGGQERSLRSGTLNVPGIVGFGKAAWLAERDLEENMKSIARLRDRLETGLMKYKGSRIHGQQAPRLSTVSNISFDSPLGKHLLENLIKDLAVSSGSACSSASTEPSHVLKAMGLSNEEAGRAIRFSLGKFNSEEEVDYVIERVGRTFKSSREMDRV